MSHNLLPPFRVHPLQGIVAEPLRFTYNVLHWYC